VIGQRSCILLDENFMIIASIVQPQDRRQVLINAVLMKDGIGKVLLVA
jgi:hypothetical protein